MLVVTSRIHLTGAVECVLQPQPWPSGVRAAGRKNRERERQKEALEPRSDIERKGNSSVWVPHGPRTLASPR